VTFPWALVLAVLRWSG